jgi:hypothetical protein
MLLSGDDLTSIGQARLAMPRTLVPPAGIAARFDDDALEVGVVTLPQARAVCVFNWSDMAKTFTVRLPAPAQVRDFRSEAALGRHERSMTVHDVPAHGARLPVCE